MRNADFENRKLKRPNSFKDYLKAVIGLALHLFKLLSQFLVAKQHLPQSHEGTDDKNTHLHCTITIKYVGRHDGTVFSENVRECSSATSYKHSSKKYWFAFF